MKHIKVFEQFINEGIYNPDEFGKIYVQQKGYVDIAKHAKENDSFRDEGLIGHVAGLMYNNNSSLDKSDISKYGNHLAQLEAVVKKSKAKGTLARRIDGMMSREAGYTNGMYEGWYNMFAEYVKSVGGGSIKPWETFQKATKAKKYNSYGSKKSIAIFGK